MADSMAGLQQKLNYQSSNGIRRRLWAEVDFNFSLQHCYYYLLLKS